MKLKKIIKRIICIVVVLAAVFGIYAAYVFGAYYRLPDNLTLEVKRNGANSYFDEDDTLVPGEAYWVMTYNIGFGAYRRDYSFFMDGGKSSWAKDKETVVAGVCAMGEIINLRYPDFVLLQEVDIDGTRSYHVDEMELLDRFMAGYYSCYAQTYDSPFFIIPPWQPHGANESGMVTYSRKKVTGAVRRSLPTSDSLSRFVDLDRCYSMIRVPVENGSTLCIYNVHLSAYGSDDQIKGAQLTVLFEDMQKEYEQGNYVVCGGDFNQSLREERLENAPDWAAPFSREALPDCLRVAFDGIKDEEDIAHDTCRSAKEPYQEGSTFTVTLDGFIVSDNMEVNYYENLDWGYEFSDHDPVVMEFILKE